MSSEPTCPLCGLPLSTEDTRVVAFGEKVHRECPEEIPA